MKQINVVLNVDENIILNESGQESLDDAISQELGWLHDSGIFVERWSFLNPEISFPMGNSIFITWPQIDNMFDVWAKTYFGNHVNGSGERDDTDCYVALWGLKETDRDKFVQLFDAYDKDRDYDPGEEFYVGELSAQLPDCITRGVLSEAFKALRLNAVGTVLATQDGVFLMENKLTYMDSVFGREISNVQVEQDSLDNVIKSASNCTTDISATESIPTKAVCFER